MAFSREECKGSIDGINALKIAKKEFPDLKAIFFSAGRAHPSIPDWVEFHRTPSLQFLVNGIYNGSSIFLCSSILEGWGLPAAEAAACGCAVVSTDNGGVREYLQHGVTGLLSPPQDPLRLAENLSLLLRNEDLRVRLATKCNQFVSSLDWDRSTDQLEDFINNVTQAQAASLAA
jgi:glycosyltransferase involved in cell wall biosynthesis